MKDFSSLDPGALQTIAKSVLDAWSQPRSLCPCELDDGLEPRDVREASARAMWGPDLPIGTLRLLCKGWKEVVTPMACRVRIKLPAQTDLSQQQLAAQLQEQLRRLGTTFKHVQAVTVDISDVDPAEAYPWLLLWRELSSVFPRAMSLRLRWLRGLHWVPANVHDMPAQNHWASWAAITALHVQLRILPAMEPLADALLDRLGLRLPNVADLALHGTSVRMAPPPDPGRDSHALPALTVRMPHLRRLAVPGHVTLDDTFLPGMAEATGLQHLQLPRAAVAVPALAGLVLASSFTRLRSLEAWVRLSRGEAALLAALEASAPANLPVLEAARLWVEVMDMAADVSALAAWLLACPALDRVGLSFVVGERGSRDPPPVRAVHLSGSGWAALAALDCRVDRLSISGLHLAQHCDPPAPAAQHLRALTQVAVDNLSPQMAAGLSHLPCLSTLVARRAKGEQLEEVVESLAGMQTLRHVTINMLYFPDLGGTGSSRFVSVMLHVSQLRDLPSLSSLGLSCASEDVLQVATEAASALTQLTHLALLDLGSCDGLRPGAVRRAAAELVGMPRLRHLELRLGGRESLQSYPWPTDPEDRRRIQEYLPGVYVTFF